MSNQIFYVRRKKNIKQFKMAKDLGVSPSFLSKVETGAQEANEKFRKACADYLGLSVKQLFEEDGKFFVQKIEKSLENKLWTMRRQQGIKQYDLAKKLKVSPSYLSKVETGSQEPSQNFMNECAKFFKMEVTELFPSK